MKRSTFIRIAKTIRQASNNVTVVENFNNKALVLIRIPSIIGESPQQQKSFRKLLAYASYYSIVPENEALLITLEFQLDS
ncbi:hypothetical protein [Anaerospora hongkongensis]|uniref:hypothetical protein n=1 Tax=Anaerospora hongkongensis TaxID=244830 RepID=UPI0028A2139D|nr:hypothetical protein [Anaerospora hongkongensis]